MTKEGWPTRKRGKRYQVFVLGAWRSRQRAAQIRREMAAAERRAAREKGSR